MAFFKKKKRIYFTLFFLLWNQFIARGMHVRVPHTFAAISTCEARAHLGSKAEKAEEIGYYRIIGFFSTCLFVARAFFFSRTFSFDI